MGEGPSPSESPYLVPGAATAARLEVLAPDGRHYATCPLEEPRLAVGRAPDRDAEPGAELMLADGETFVSRTHCFLERSDGHWWVRDNHSANGTFLRRGTELEAVGEGARLVHGDVVCIVGGVEPPLYWQLRFVDPESTRSAGLAPPARDAPKARLRYDAGAAKLYCDTGAAEQAVPLRPREHRFVRYMAERNAQGDGVPVLCTYAELIDAVWGASTPSHRTDELHSLVLHFRRRLSKFTGDPLIENERGLGYRLLT